VAAIIAFLNELIELLPISSATTNAHRHPGRAANYKSRINWGNCHLIQINKWRYAQKDN
jgi:hypothetical protein